MPHPHTWFWHVSSHVKVCAVSFALCSFIMHADGRPTGMAFIEFETPHEAVRAMEKDRAKFGPEYGDRFCMLQLVGRHEMDKVQLQREGDSGSLANNKLLVSGQVMHTPTYLLLTCKLCLP